MAVQKAFAYLFIENVYQLISAVEAVERRSNFKNSVYYDSKGEDKRKVFVSKNKKTPSFHYYKTEKIEFLDKSKPMTREHRLFQESLSKIKKIKIAPYTRKRQMPVTIYIKEWHVEYKLETREKDKYFRIDVLAQLNGTYPFSLFYGWNSCLAIEVNVTHKVDEFKNVQLGKIGAQVFEVKVPKKINNLIKENFYYSDTELVSCIVDELEKESTILYGEFINRATILDRYKERYIKMANFESEIEQLKKNKKQARVELTELATQLALYQEKKNQLAATSIELQEKMKLYDLDLKRLQEETEQAKKVDKEEYKTTADNLQKENDTLNQMLQKIKTFSFGERLGFLFDKELIEQMVQNQKTTPHHGVKVEEESIQNDNKKILMKQPIINFENIPKKKEGWFSKLKNLRK